MSELPDEVRRFIAGNLSSVAQLELLLLLREDREREWTVEEVSRALYGAAAGMADQLNDLVSQGLVYVTHAPEPRFRFRPSAGDPLDVLVGRVAETYKERRVAVITLIYSQPVDAARTFAEAFRFRKSQEGR